MEKFVKELFTDEVLEKVASLYELKRQTIYSWRFRKLYLWF